MGEPAVGVSGSGRGERNGGRREEGNARFSKKMYALVGDWPTRKERATKSGCKENLF